MLVRSHGYPVDEYNWIPLVSFSFVIFIANWAVLTLTFLVISEIMPDNLKSFGSSFCMRFTFIYSSTLNILVIYYYVQFFLHFRYGSFVDIFIHCHQISTTFDGNSGNARNDVPI